MVRYSLFVLKVSLNTNKTNKPKKNLWELLVGDFYIPDAQTDPEPAVSKH